MAFNTYFKFIEINLDITRNPLKNRSHTSTKYVRMKKVQNDETVERLVEYSHVCCF